MHHANDETLSAEKRESTITQLPKKRWHRLFYSAELAGPNVHSLTQRVRGVRGPSRLVIEAVAVHKPIRLVILSAVIQNDVRPFVVVYVVILFCEPFHAPV